MRFSEFNTDNSIILYHGSDKKFSKFNTPEVYLTDDEEEAEQYAFNVHRFGTKNTNNYVYEIAAKLENVFDASEIVDSIIAEENEHYETIEDLIDYVRKNGYYFIYFEHPGIISDTINVYVSLRPDIDLKILNIF